MLVCHLIIPSRQHSFIFANIVCLIKFVLFSFLGYWSSYNFLCVLIMVWKYVTCEVPQHGFWHWASRNKSSAQNCLPHLTDHDQLHVYMIRIFLFSQASNIDKIYSGHLITWWHHQMEKFSALLALCEGNPPVTGGFPSEGQWHGVLMFSLICTWINGWANNWDAGDLRCHHTHYDITAIN